MSARRAGLGGQVGGEMLSELLGLHPASPIDVVGGDAVLGSARPKEEGQGKDAIVALHAGVDEALDAMLRTLGTVPSSTLQTLPASVNPSVVGSRVTAGYPGSSSISP